MTRTRICFYILLLAPLLVYWPTVFHDYGFRDDYLNLREAREEPGKLVRHTASHGRPLYGALLETSYGNAEDVSNLRWLRLTSVMLLTLLGLTLWRQLYQSGWTEIQAAAIGLGVTLLPAAQITASTGSGWPQVLALLLAVAGFAAIEAELERGGMKRAIALIGGGLIYLLAGLVYQSNALFALVPITAVLLVRSGREPLADFRWAAIHIATLVAGLVGSWLLVRWLFSSGIFLESARMQVETNYITKLGWFLWQPVPNALGLFALRDSFSAVNPFFWSSVLVTLVVLFFGVRSTPEPLAKRKWLLCLAALPFLAHAVSIFAAERATGYRTLFALSGLVLVLVLFALRSLLTNRWSKPRRQYLVFGVLAAAAALAANHHAFALMAKPQGHEWDLMLSPVMRTPFKGETKVFLVTPAVADRSTDLSFADEFGSLSSESGEVAREMFTSALRERFGPKLPRGASVKVDVGPEAPAEGAYNLVIDLRKLRDRRGQ